MIDSTVPIYESIDLEYIQSRLRRDEKIILQITYDDCFLELIGKAGKIEYNDLVSNNATINEAIENILS